MEDLIKRSEAIELLKNLPSAQQGAVVGIREKIVKLPTYHTDTVNSMLDKQRFGKERHYICLEELLEALETD